jgi:hypothetical protein
VAFSVNSYEISPFSDFEAARLRALHALKMPDAIHAATAKIARSPTSRLPTRCYLKPLVHAP